MARVVVIGGGLAGCSAALALAEAGWSVTLCEKRAHLGGRACSFRPPGWDTWVDNSQHVTLRCCTNLLDLYQRLGVSERIDWHDRLALVAPDGQRGTFAGWPLPAPGHLAPALFRLPGLGARDRLALAAAFARMLVAGRAPAALAEVPFSDWLGSTTTARLDAGFWRLMLTSVLNADADRVSAAAALMFFREGLMRHPTASHLGVPQVSLHELHHVAMLARLGELGVTVRLRTAATARVADGRLAGVVIAGEAQPADQVVVAVPWWQVTQTVSGAAVVPPAATELAPEAIVGVHLRFARPVLSEPVVGLFEGGVDWVFATDGGRRLSVVVSDARDWAGLSSAATAERAVAALRRIWPDLPDPLLTAACREARATFVPGPGVDHCRPGPETAVGGVVLAGEWTATGWPSTMEGAVRSGYAAAQALTGRPTVVPNLPRSGLMRWALAP